MKKKYIIQNLVTKLYWYGNFSNKQWTENVREAIMYDEKEEIDFYIMEYMSDQIEFVYTVLEIFLNCKDID
jgi:hypothetical protein